jgi:Eukaryotic aspartyl protease.
MRILAILITLTILSLTIHSSDVPRIKLSKQSFSTSYQTPFLNALYSSDLGDHPYCIRASFGNSRANPMALALYKSRSFVSGCQEYFQYFNCSEFPDSCTPFPNNNFSVDYPFFNISGYEISLEMSAGEYGTGKKITAYYAQNCSNNTFGTSSLFGAIGLGIDDYNYLNFNSPDKLFSIFLSTDGTDGELIFGEDTYKEIDNTQLFLYNVTSNWEIALNKISTPKTMYNLENAFAILDVSSPFIGLPSAIYDGILTELREKYGMSCKNDTYLPTCKYTGLLNTLSVITLEVTVTGDNIPMPPDVYLQHLGSSTYQLLLASLSSNSTKPYEMKLTDSYKNYVVLGAPFLQYYYSIYNYTDPAKPFIVLYRSNQSFFNSIRNVTIAIVFFGLLLLLCIYIGYRYTIQRSKRKEMNKVEPLNYVEYRSPEVGAE